MAEFDISNLKEKYEDFQSPLILVEVEGKKIDKDEHGVEVSGCEVELTSGYEAAIAEVSLFGAYNGTIFDTSKIKNIIAMGSSIKISLGYGASVREVFKGFIARVNFVLPKSTYDDPYIQLTAMDIKGNMMANRHSRRLNSKYFSDAVKEVIEANPFYGYKDEQQKNFTELVIDNTPDKPEGAGDGGAGAGGAAPGGGAAGGAAAGGAEGEKTDDVRVEMVEESDYEFIVKAAKKFNFEFFTVGGVLYFIKAKKNEDVLMEFVPGEMIRSLDVGYDITGLVGQVEVRNVDSDKGDFVGKTQKLSGKISIGNKAKPLVTNQSLVYIDPTAQSKESAGYRAEYLSAQASYRLGNLAATIIGLPEVVPGRFIELKDMGVPVNNTFYVTRVKHVIYRSEYTTEIEGCAKEIKTG
ncbi:MAG: hypothetical protein J6O71_03680 [Lachnospiraceae bacterium]|nr:hypothetical protein [Lachnospiraceae bacterium]